MQIVETFEDFDYIRGHELFTEVAERLQCLTKTAILDVSAGKCEPGKQTKSGIDMANEAGLTPR